MISPRRAGAIAVQEQIGSACRPSTIPSQPSLPVTRAAEILGVRGAALSDLAGGKPALSPEMALRIEKAFGVSMDTVLRMQAWHDSHAMRQRAAEIDVKRYEPA
jgi:antitoxin HigA-1